MRMEQGVIEERGTGMVAEPRKIRPANGRREGSRVHCTFWAKCGDVEVAVHRR